MSSTRNRGSSGVALRLEVPAHLTLVDECGPARGRLSHETATHTLRLGSSPGSHSFGGWDEGVDQSAPSLDGSDVGFGDRRFLDRLGQGIFCVGGGRMFHRGGWGELLPGDRPVLGFSWRGVGVSVVDALWCCGGFILQCLGVSVCAEADDCGEHGFRYVAVGAGR